METSTLFLNCLSPFFCKNLFLFFPERKGWINESKGSKAMFQLLRFKIRYIYSQKSLSSQEGFTLLELMIVLLITSVLAGIALPSLIRQVGKAREAEAKNTLSAVGFAQQGYFFEYQTFASTYLDLGLNFQTKYFDFPDPESIPNTYRTKSQAITKDNGLNGSRSYALGTYYNSGSYKIVLCQSSNSGTVTQVPDDVNGTCSNGGVRIE